ncbi:MAG: lytic transglycosylase domain-containing protein, partial [Novosphingobium sp.]
MRVPLRVRAGGWTAVVALAMGLAAAPAQANSAAADDFRARGQRSEVPTLLTADDRTYYRAVFSAIAREDWAGAEALFAQRGD